MILVKPYQSWFLRHIISRKYIFLFVVFGIIVHMSVRLVIPYAFGEVIENIAKDSLSKISTFALILLVAGITAEFFDLIMSAGNEILAQTVEMNTRTEFFDSKY